jgi:protein O-mannosyl-transferase
MSQTGTPETFESTQVSALGSESLFKPTHWVGLLVLLLVTVGVYAQMYGQQFVYFDDNEYVFENVHVATGLSWENIKWAFTSMELANWHPLTVLSHQLDCALFGLNAGAHKVVSLGLHLACTALVFLFFTKITRSGWAGLFIAGAFALHPVNVEAVAWISQRKTLLSTLFAMASLLAYLRYAAAPSVGRYLLVCFWLALSLMSKPMGVTTPLLFVLLDFWPLGRLKGCVDPTSPESYKPLEPGVAVVPVENADSIVPGFDWRALGRLVLEKAPMLAMTALICGVTLLAQRGAASSIDRVGVWDRLGNVLIGFVRYLKMAVWPVDLAVLYPISTPDAVASVAAGVVLCALTYGAWRLAGRYPYVMVGWLWYVVTLVPVIGLVQVGSQSHADRYAYTPLLGIWLVAALGIPELMRGRLSIWQPVLGVGAGAFLLAMGVSTWAQVGFWQDTKTLFSRAAMVTERNYTAYAQVGRAYMQEKDYDKGAMALDESLKISPSQPDVWASLGMCIIRLGRPDIALDKLHGPMQQYPDNPELLYVSAQAYSMIAVRLDEVGKKQEAKELFEEAAGAVGKMAHPDAAALLVKGNALYALGRDAEALTALEESEKAGPGNADTACMRALVLMRMGRPKEALAPMKYAAENRRDRLSLYNLGMLYDTLGQSDKARAVLEVVCEKWPEYSDGRLGLAGVLIKQGDKENARTLIEGVLKMDPGNVRAAEMKGKL